MDTISLWFPLALTIQLSLHIYLLDVVTTYLHGILDTTHSLSPPPGFLLHISSPTPGRYIGLNILKALYSLKQVDRTWYHHNCNFFISKGFRINSTLQCIFIYSTSVGFVIVAVYVNDLNVIDIFNLCQYTHKLLTQHFNMKLLGKTIFLSWSLYPPSSWW